MQQAPAPVDQEMDKWDTCDDPVISKADGLPTGAPGPGPIGSNVAKSESVFEQLIKMAKTIFNAAPTLIPK